MKKIYYKHSKFNGKTYKIVKELVDLGENHLTPEWYLYDSNNKYIVSTICYQEITDYLNYGTLNV